MQHFVVVAVFVVFVVNSLFIAAPIVCGGSVFGPWFVMQYMYFVSVLVLQSIC